MLIGMYHESPNSVLHRIESTLVQRHLFSQQEFYHFREIEQKPHPVDVLLVSLDESYLDSVRSFLRHYLKKHSHCRVIGIRVIGGRQVTLEGIHEHFLIPIIGSVIEWGHLRYLITTRKQK